MKIYKLFALIFFLCLGSCESKEEKIKSQWKFMEGYHFGDFLDLKNKKVEIRGDTLYLNSTPFAIIENLENSYYPGTENKLILKDIKTGKKGIYTDKGK